MLKNTLLKMDHLSDEEKEEFSVVSQKEIQSILEKIAEDASSVALYYKHAQCSILTSVLGVDDSGFWLEQSRSDEDNTQILESEDLFFVGSHLAAKVQFATGQAYSVKYDEYPAFYFYMPEEIYRIQRRECFRIDLPSSASLQCIIPAQPGLPGIGKPHTVAIEDISIGGVRLKCREGEIDLEPGHTYDNCLINLPNIGKITVGITVMNQVVRVTQSRQTIIHAGCKFTKIDGPSSIMLARYITDLQRAARARSE